MSHPNTPSIQGYRTDPAFLSAVERKFATALTFDLACTRTDRIASATDGFHFPEQDALASPWPTMPEGTTAWANYPFAKGHAFLRVAAESPHCRSILLGPASVGSRWFAEHVHGRALVVFLRPRIVFLQPDGTPCPAGINRDCALMAYGWPPGYHCENWTTW